MSMVHPPLPRALPPALLLTNRPLVCSPLQGMLVESEKREMGGDIACLAVAPVPEGRQRCRYLAVRWGSCGGMDCWGCRDDPL